LRLLAVIADEVKQACARSDDEWTTSAARFAAALSRLTKLDRKMIMLNYRIEALCDGL
jgi:hypothetical protein